METAVRNTQILTPIEIINGVEYGIYPSQMWDKFPADNIEDAGVVEETTDESDYSMDPYTITRKDMKNIFDDLREKIDNDTHGDVDGYRYEVDYKMFRIEAIHHYQGHEEHGGDSYCGVWEMVGVVDEDRIEVVKVFDEDGIKYPDVMQKLNEYAKITL